MILEKENKIQLRRTDSSATWAKVVHTPVTITHFLILKLYLLKGLKQPPRILEYRWLKYHVCCLIDQFSQMIVITDEGVAYCGTSTLSCTSKISPGSLDTLS